jgi:pyruvate dehydrogenase E1 component beta subunit/2-oxoisovalerate dehydrogenase E1 component beta subunit
LLCVGEAWPWGGVTAEVIARVATEAFGMLDAPPQRLNAKDTPVPYHPNLWRRIGTCVDGAARNLSDDDIQVQNQSSATGWTAD